MLGDSPLLLSPYQCHVGLGSLVDNDDRAMSMSTVMSTDLISDEDSDFDEVDLQQKEAELSEADAQLNSIANALEASIKKPTNRQKHQSDAFTSTPRSFPGEHHHDETSKAQDDRGPYGTDMHSSASSAASRESVLSPSAQALDNQDDVFSSIEGLLSQLEGRQTCMHVSTSASRPGPTGSLHGSASNIAGHTKDHGYNSCVF
ncbi:hypothetical protein COCOBI_03-1340 [Coccomyxa sp. Obi]|nr:hypothetical protein COCOBI_03-1340 [Coccomyxa sp. Obi]